MKTLVIMTIFLISQSAHAKMTKKHFIRVLESVEKIYAPIVKEMGAKLVLYQGYDFNTVNAISQRYGDDWIISFYGGLAKYSRIDDDALRFVVCHEIGHHLAGYPFKLNDDGTARWSSAEAQADYFASNECLKKAFSDSEQNQFAVSKYSADLREQLENTCSDDQCMRVLGSSLKAIDAFNQLRPEPVNLSYLTPELDVVNETNLEYPSYQCRIDTIKAGYFGNERPSCWFRD